MCEERLSEQVLDWMLMLPGKRQRGRPTKEWWQGVVEEVLRGQLPNKTLGKKGT